MSQTQVGSDHESTTTTPRWVNVFGIIILVLVLLFGIMLFTGGGEHSPNRHIPSGDVGDTSSIDPGGHTPPLEHGG